MLSLQEMPLIITLPTSARLAEPVRIPQQGRPWTADDLLALADDSNRYELIKGELFVMSPASPVQGR